MGMGIERWHERGVDGCWNSDCSFVHGNSSFLFFSLGYKIIAFCVLCLREFQLLCSYGCVCGVCVLRIKVKIHSGNVKMKSFFKKRRNILHAAVLCRRRRRRHHHIFNVVVTQQTWAQTKNRRGKPFNSLALHVKPSQFYVLKCFRLLFFPSSAIAV